MTQLSSVKSVSSGGQNKRIGIMLSTALSRDACIDQWLHDADCFFNLGGRCRFGVIDKVAANEDGGGICFNHLLNAAPRGIRIARPHADLKV